MTKKQLRMYVNMRLMELAECRKVGEPRFNMRAVNARIAELESLLRLFGTEDQD